MTAHAFFGVAFLGVAFFVVAFAAAAFLGAPFCFGATAAALSGALVLVTRPDLVLPRTRVTSFSTAGAGAAAVVAAALRGLLALALGLAVAVAAFFVVAGFAAAFLGAGPFFVVVAFAFFVNISNRSVMQPGNTYGGSSLSLGSSLGLSSRLCLGRGWLLLLLFLLRLGLLHDSGLSLFLRKLHSTGST